MAYKFTTQKNSRDTKIVKLRGKNIRWIMVKASTSPKKFLEYFKELKKAGRIAYCIYETDALANLMYWADNGSSKILTLKINESCTVHDNYDLYKITRVSRHLCHCQYIREID